MMKKCCWLVAVLSLCLSFTVGPAALASEKNITIKLASLGLPDPFKSAGYASKLVFKDQVETNSGGRILVDIFPAGQLGNETDSLEAIKNGVIEMFSASMVGLNRIFPPAFVMGSPYLFRNLNVAYEVSEGPYGQKLLDAFTEKTGIKGLSVLSLGFSAISNSVRPIRTPEDFKEIKFRGMGKMQVAMFESLGASAVPISWTEVYTSLQTGVVKGQTNPPAIIDAFKIYEVQKYLTLCNTQYSYQFWVANKPWYDSLSKADKEIISEALTVANITAKGMGALLNQKAVENLKAAGMQVDALSAEEIAGLQQVARPKCLAWLKTEIDPQWVDELQAAIVDAEKKLSSE